MRWRQRKEKVGRLGEGRGSEEKEKCDGQGGEHGLERENGKRRR